MSRRRLFVLILLLLAGISVWLVVEISRVDNQKTSTSKLGRDYFMDNIISVIMDKSGTPKYRLTAEKLAHYPGDQHVELTSPYITLYRSSGKVWTISASQGKLLNDNNEVQLTGDVILKNILENSRSNSLYKKSKAQTIMTISTQAINIFADKRLASTDKAVTISTEYGKISAVGMNLYTDKQILELKSAVRGNYASAQ
jgi:lipopolysaccharide export system protein LptC